MILLTNDDGFYAKGIQALRKGLASVTDVVMVAPEAEQSAVGHAISLSNPLKVRRVEEKGELIGYAVNGTPADCVKIAVTELLEEPPELVISGVNQGGNLGTCVIYSGTVSAATEAAIMGLPAIAVSLNSFEVHDFSAAVEFVLTLFPQVIRKGLPEGVSLNVNVPAVPRDQIQGAVVTRQGKSRVIETFDKRINPRRETYYWLAGEMKFDEVEKGTDCEMVAENYISVTPIHFDLTHFKTLDDLREWKIDF
ncbi:MAG: 5'/3'-nucleotidase SurE [Nitrospinaceae bacterium]|nr:5'/3'-nucleotidase SurE [Nitrospinaceae bacterium]NIR54617.1 5'/3'-nucleotidase SurE [Nitrospinaceae bacterium]NIS85034.1 5'/3'-nucleotidase SurE [Nitrospinaceae bacterium]NIT81850.1 5'/3'-nucleotidase SurE [Nitrospinaceae bacterium]NIU44115.1 5'/3'-nucleotidase SurE [Nitrospinaceae bacterium]